VTKATTVPMPLRSMKDEKRPNYILYLLQSVLNTSLKKWIYLIKYKIAVVA